MDDIVFCGKTREELRANTLEGLHILEKHNLYVKESKCYWEVEEHPNQRMMSTSGMGFVIFTADTSKGTLVSPNH
jgi:hypothetical protein